MKGMLAYGVANVLTQCLNTKKKATGRMPVLQFLFAFYFAAFATSRFYQAWSLRNQRDGSGCASGALVYFCYRIVISIGSPLN